MENLLLLGATLIIAVIGVGTVKTIKAAAKYGKKGGKKAGNVMMKAMVRILTGFFGKLLIPVCFIGYYFSDSFIIQAVLLLALFGGVRCNFYGKRLHLIKSKTNPLGNPVTKPVKANAKTTTALGNSMNQL